MFFRFKQNKNIVNVTSVSHKFKLRRTFLKPHCFVMAKKALASVEPKGEAIATPSLCL